MKVLNSPLTGKPMRVVYEPDTMTFRGEKFDCVYMSFRDDESGESFTTRLARTVWGECCKDGSDFGLRHKPIPAL